MDIPAALPTTSVALIAFITTVNLSTVITFIKYIQKKNGHLERVAKNFSEEMADARNKFDDMLTKQGERHENIMRNQMDYYGRQNRNGA